jgi:hypothetical protein
MRAVDGLQKEIGHNSKKSNLSNGYKMQLKTKLEKWVADTSVEPPGTN